jgi:hypothetical protein
LRSRPGATTHFSPLFEAGASGTLFFRRGTSLAGPAPHAHPTLHSPGIKSRQQRFFAALIGQIQLHRKVAEVHFCDEQFRKQNPQLNLMKAIKRIRRYLTAGSFADLLKLYPAGVGYLLTAVLLLIATPPRISAQVDDFDDGNDNGWTRFDPLGSLGAGPRAMFSFPNGGYRIQALNSPSPSTAGPARAGSLRADVTYSSFYVAVDLVSWDNTTDQSVGLLARIQPGWGLGTVNGYAFTYQPLDRDVQMFRVVNESPTAITPTFPIYLEPGTIYRMVLKGEAENITGEIYDASDMTTPLVSLTAEDTRYESGVCGLVIYDGSSGGARTADATFDNYFAAASEPIQPPVLRITFEQGIPVLRWPQRATGFLLQSKTSLTSPGWNTITEDITVENSEFVHVNYDFENTLFFRLMKP